MNRAILATFLATAALLLAPAPADAQCSGGSACPPCTMCRVPPANGSNPTVSEMSVLFDRIAAGPAVYGSLGWNFGSRNTIGSGPGWCNGGTDSTVPAHFPCILLKAIYLTESSWRQFCTAGQTVISFDCGYGIAQVTSGMRPGETSAFDPDRVAGEAAYNVSVGAAILADKWRASPCVGDNDVDVIEDWYFAVWGYNGFVFRNNPNNPMFDPARPEFRTPGVASAQTRANYPYQELVWGYAHYPLTAAHYTGIGLAYPRRSEICASCGLPSANISEPSGSHRSVCGDGSVAMDASVDVGVPMDVTMPPLDSGFDGGVVDARADVSNRDALPQRESGETNGGCGCAVPGSRDSRGSTAGAWLGILALAAATRRRRSKR